MIFPSANAVAIAAPPDTAVYAAVSTRVISGPRLSKCNATEREAIAGGLQQGGLGGAQMRGRERARTTHVAHSKIRRRQRGRTNSQQPGPNPGRPGALPLRRRLERSPRKNARDSPAPRGHLPAHAARPAARPPRVAADARWRRHSAATAASPRWGLGFRSPHQQASSLL